MNEIEEKLNIKDMIYEIRGKQVMLDSDLAKLYECKNGTKTINQAVKRNVEKFPNDFLFQLTSEEFLNLKSQVGTSSINTYGGVRKLPYVFTEQGVAMLATILRTPVATKVSIDIMRAFVEMRKFIYSNRDIFRRVISMENNIEMLNDKQKENEKKFDLIFNEFKGKEFNEKLFFNGQIYDAYSLLINIIREAKTKIIIIDNYFDKNILDILAYKDDNVKAEIYVKNMKTKLDIDKFNLQYSNTIVKVVSNFHDRFIIIDDKNLYHIGASLKDLGKKCFAINKLDNFYISSIKKQLKL